MGMEIYFFTLLQSGSKGITYTFPDYILCRASYPVVEDHQVLAVGYQLVRILVMEDQVCLVRKVLPQSRLAKRLVGTFSPLPYPYHLCMHADQNVS
jgi:hypothetical protein